jgi:phage gpG-like protein
VNVTIREIRNDFHAQLPRIVEGLRGAGKRELLRTAGYEFWQITRESFGANKPNRPAYWAALSPFTIRYYKEKGISPLVPTLLRAGTLMNSIRLRVDNDQYAEVFTTCDYAATHQFGNPFLGVPARPYFPVIDDRLTPYAEARILAKLEAKLQQMIRFGI